MENNLGKVTKEADGFQVRFERVLNHDVHTVWNAITNPDKLKYWFTDIEMDFKPGGKVTIRFRDEEKTATYGEIVSIEQPSKFAFTWEGELAVWELFTYQETKCKLILTYSKLTEEYAVNAPAGFHSLLDRLEEMLAGSTTIYPFGAEEVDSEELKLKQLYAEMIYKKYPELERLQPIVVERTYNAPVEKVWKAITDKDQMKQWYFDLSEFRPEVGFEFQFNGQGHKGQQYVHYCKITEVIENKKLTYSWSYKDHEGMSFVSFELKDLEGKTHLTLTHKGLHSFPANNPDFARESFNGGWTELIGTLLKNFVEQ